MGASQRAESTQCTGNTDAPSRVCPVGIVRFSGWRARAQPRTRDRSAYPASRPTPDRAWSPTRLVALLFRELRQRPNAFRPLRCDEARGQPSPQRCALRPLPLSPVLRPSAPRLPPPNRCSSSRRTETAASRCPPRRAPHRVGLSRAEQQRGGPLQQAVSSLPRKTQRRYPASAGVWVALPLRPGAAATGAPPLPRAPCDGFPPARAPGPSPSPSSLGSPPVSSCIRSA